MYSRLLYLYQQSKLDETGLSLAVSKGWITDNEKATIIASVSTTTTTS